MDIGHIATSRASYFALGWHNELEIKWAISQRTRVNNAIQMAWRESAQKIIECDGTGKEHLQVTNFNTDRCWLQMQRALALNHIIDLNHFVSCLGMQIHLFKLENVLFDDTQKVTTKNETIILDDDLIIFLFRFSWILGLFFLWYLIVCWMRMFWMELRILLNALNVSM